MSTSVPERVMRTDYETERALAHATRAVNVRRRPVAPFQRLELPGERRGFGPVLAFLLALAMVVFSWPVSR